MSVLELHQVSKTFELVKRAPGIKGWFQKQTIEKKALDSVSFAVKPGEMVGFVGPNGAGKSTTLRIMSGILFPTTGRVLVNGADPCLDRKQVSRSIGAVFGQSSQLWPELSIDECLMSLRYLYGVSDAVYHRQREMLVELLGLAPFIKMPVRRLSLGQRMRGEIAAAFLHDPQLVILDEPTIGLDVTVKASVREFLHNIHREKGVTCILTTHNMDEIESLCDRFLLLDQGRLVYDGSTETFKSQYGRTRTLQVTFSTPVREPIMLVNGQVIQQSDYEVIVVFPVERSAAQLIVELSQVYPVQDCKLTEPAIESLVQGYYAASARQREEEGN